MTHKQQSAKLQALGLSQRATARALNVPATQLGSYLTRGKIAPCLGNDFGKRLDAYIAKQVETAATGMKVKAQPMSGNFSRLGMPLVKLAEVLELEFIVLKKGIYSGLWPDEKTKTVVERYINEQIDQKPMEEKTMINAIPIPEEALEAFGLKVHPFGPIRSKDDILITKEMAHAIKIIKNGIEQADMTAITGGIGSGKTTILQKLYEWAATRNDIVLVRPAIIEKQFMRGSHIIDAVLEDIGFSVKGHKNLEQRARFVRRALEQAQNDGRIVVLVLDEMHLAEISVLLCIKRLWEVERDCQKLLRIVLVGQPALARSLKTNFQLTELGQRIHLHELGGLNGATATYIRHRLDRAGANGREVFEASAVKLIAKKCSTPLEVNCLASQALVSAYSTGDKIVSAEDVEAVQGGWRG